LLVLRMQEDVSKQKIFFRKYTLDSYDAASAGTKHTSEINPVAVKTMSQIGIDICFLL